MSDSVKPGPLAGLSVVEMAGIGPAPFATMMLSDLGASVTRIDRAGAAWDRAEVRSDIVSRGRTSIALNLKSAEGVSIASRMIADADVLIEGFRPGVMERLGLGPEKCLGDNPGLVYGRMTGWGQDGPLAKRAGHDINYIALSGALNSIGRAGQAPVPPLNLVGDYGGGGMLLAFGVLAALISRRQTGLGQVVDVAMVDGASILMAAIYGLRANGQWSDERGTNLLDGGTPYYDVYETADGGYMAVGCLEPQFFAQLITRLELEERALAMHSDPSSWPELRRMLAAAFRAQPRDHWAGVFADSDACVSPVLTMGEAPAHPHNQARANFQIRHDLTQPAPAPRFSMTPARLSDPPPTPGEHTRQILTGLGIDENRISELLRSGAAEADDA